MAAFSNLKIISLDKSVPDNVVIEFELPPELKEQFKFHPGQFVVVKYVVKGQEYKRSYSISSSSLADIPLQITVKRVGDGITSNYANNELKVGDVLDVTTPRGKFCIELNPEAEKIYYLIAAGSGIAPMHSMLQSVLVGEPKSKICLVYGNRDDDNIIFGKEIMAIAQQHPERLKVQHILSRQTKPLNLLKNESILEGRINEHLLKNVFAPPLPDDYKVFVCGPSEMNLACKEILANLSLPKEKVHIEFFGKI
jgi:ring-1,2-phenylacetyl-CoA epoxidase subunit PaaE